MWHFIFVRLFFRDLWVPVWPNLAASLLWGPVVVYFHRRSMYVHLQKHHESLLDKLAELTGLEEHEDAEAG